ncbi:hypothetical protein GGX14DRAFT_700577 [Mycena pura]|uniref:DUF6534 domain-containing protein n=1 Tax=Mycena pura TaxID=153505 RepID=A0AAD6V3F0_9AGAR|nr:hypothetical protein GGX14DRAFT_700577 [Mycena pura]
MASIDLTIGAYQIGVLLSFVLLGVLLVQTYVYFIRFPDDTAKTKTLVAFVGFCDIVQAACIAAALYDYTITGFGDFNRLSRAPTTLFIAIFFSGPIGAFVQGFFALRIYVLSKKLYIPCACWVLSFFRCIGTTMVFITAVRTDTGTFAAYLAHWQWLVTSIWVISATNDLLIAVTLAFLLFRKRGNAHPRTIQLVNKMIAYTIETGMVTCAATFLTLVFFYAINQSFIFLAVFVVGTRLYSNSLLATLNSRIVLRELNEVNLSHIISPTRTQRNLPSSGVQVSKVTTVTHDRSYKDPPPQEFEDSEA